VGPLEVVRHPGAAVLPRSSGGGPPSNRRRRIQRAEQGRGSLDPTAVRLQGSRRSRRGSSAATACCSSFVG
jgi:hypothetical protein